MASGNAYDDLIMDHIRNARNYFVPEGGHEVASGSNPLCGDELTVYVKRAQSRIESVAFQCTCCGVSMASASIMSELVRGMSVHEAHAMLDAFRATLLAREDPGAANITPEQRALIETVKRFPSRNVCAALPWQILEGALSEAKA
jgi:nitrogen fixation NifU-like protein